METTEDVYKAPVQIAGDIAHKTTNNKTLSHRKDDILSLPVYSDELGIMGVIDLYKGSESLLIERKNHIKQIYRGQIYQLWGQYFCMKEMGYDVKKLAFYEISTHKTTYIPLPTQKDKEEFISFINNIRRYDPSMDISIVSPNKCLHCIYAALCDKTNMTNVYT